MNYKKSEDGNDKPVSVEEMFKKDVAESVFEVKDESLPPKVEEEKEQAIPSEEGKDDKNPLPKEEPFHKHPRFKKIVEEKRKSEEEVARLLEENDRLKNNTTTPEDEGLPSWWVELYGNDDASKRAWSIQIKREDELVKKAKQETLKEIKEEEARRVEESKKWDDRIEEELSTIEDQFKADFSSDKPEAKKARTEFLEIVFDLSPKDDKGNILAYAPFDKAYEYYTIKNGKQEKKEDPAIQKRKDIASLSMNKGQEPVKGDEAPNKPGGWGAWRAKYFPDAK